MIDDMIENIQEHRVIEKRFDYGNGEEIKKEFYDENDNLFKIVTYLSDGQVEEEIIANGVKVHLGYLNEEDFNNGVPTAHYFDDDDEISSSTQHSNDEVTSSYTEVENNDSQLQTQIPSYQKGQRIYVGDGEFDSVFRAKLNQDIGGGQRANIYYLGNNAHGRVVKDVIGDDGTITLRYVYGDLEMKEEGVVGQMILAEEILQAEPHLPQLVNDDTPMDMDVNAQIMQPQQNPEEENILGNCGDQDGLNA